MGKAPSVSLCSAAVVHNLISQRTTRGEQEDVQVFCDDSGGRRLNAHLQGAHVSYVPEQRTEEK